MCFVFSFLPGLTLLGVYYLFCSLSSQTSGLKCLSLFLSFSLGRLWKDSCNFWSPRKLWHNFPQCTGKKESVLLGSSYLSSSWNIVCHVSIFDRPLCKLLFLCDSEIWAFPSQRMMSFSWKKLISGSFIPSCQKSWVFLLMERSCINYRTLLFLHSFSIRGLCVYIYTLML